MARIGNFIPQRMISEEIYLLLKITLKKKHDLHHASFGLFSTAGRGPFAAAAARSAAGIGRRQIIEPDPEKLESDG